MPTKHEPFLMKFSVQAERYGTGQRIERLVQLTVQLDDQYRNLRCNSAVQYQPTSAAD